MYNTSKLDRAKAEVLRRLLDHPPGPLTTPVYTLDEALWDIEEADCRSENAGCDLKDTGGEVLFQTAEVAQVSDQCRAPVPVTLSLVGKSEPSQKPRPTTQRPRQRAQIVRKPKPTLKKEKPKKRKTLTILDRVQLEDAYFVAHALRLPFNVELDLNPGIDDLDYAARLEFWAAVMVNIRSYIRARCIARGKPLSWWPFVYIGVRESNRYTHSEHLHVLIHVPDDREVRHLINMLKDKRSKDDAKKWCDNAIARWVDDLEHWNGRKFVSALGYILKAADQTTIARDSTVWYKRSGFITGSRPMISKNLTNPKVIAEAENEVRMLRRLRDERRAIMRRNGSKPAKDPRSPVRKV